MAAPSTSLATYRPDLGGSFEEFSLEANAEGFIGLQAAPVIEVSSASENPGKIKLAQLLQDVETRRVSGAGYNRGKWEFEKFSYATEEHGFEEPVDDRQRRMYRDYFDLEMMATRRARARVLTNLEKRIAAKYAAASNSAAAGTVWTSAQWANATPIANVEAAQEAIRARTGFYGNALILTRKMFRNVRNCAQVLDRITGGGGAQASRADLVTAEQLARVFDVEMVLVAGGHKNTANEKQTAVLASIWGDTACYVARVATTQDVMEPCAVRTFHWGEDGSSVGAVIETYRDESVRSDVVRARCDIDEVTMYDEMIEKITGISA